jgi:hypothetical protein
MPLSAIQNACDVDYALRAIRLRIAELRKRLSIGSMTIAEETRAKWQNELSALERWMQGR